MKVITQLIRHFWERGVLTPDDVDYLLRHGFARPQDVPGFRAPKAGELAGGPWNAETPVEPPDELELLEESLVRRCSPRRGGHEPHGAELRIDDVLDRLRDEYRRRENDCSSLLSLGQRVEPVRSWQEAAAELHATTDDRFYAELCDGMKDGSVLMGDIWQATEVEPFHRLFHDDEIRGQAVRAYLSLLVTPQPPALGKYAWILRYDEAHTLLNLRIVHDRLLTGLCRMYREQRHLMTRALEANQDVVQVWSLILLYNAHRQPNLGDQPDYGAEYGPLSLPSDDVWRSAWTSALRMDRPAVSQFLVACYDESDRDELETDDSCRKALMCPVGWRIPDENPTTTEA